MYGSVRHQASAFKRPSYSNCRVAARFQNSSGTRSGQMLDPSAGMEVRRYTEYWDTWFNARSREATGWGLCRSSAHVFVQCARRRERLVGGGNTDPVKLSSGLSITQGVRGLATLCSCQYDCARVTTRKGQCAGISPPTQPRQLTVAGAGYHPQLGLGPATGAPFARQIAHVRLTSNLDVALALRSRNTRWGCNLVESL